MRKTISELGDEYQSRIKDAERHVTSIVEKFNIPESVFGLKSVEDKILYYYNYLDKDNKFCEIVEFPKIEQIKLANLLCKTVEDVDDYLTNYHCVDNEYFGLLRYKKDKLKSRNDISEYETKINKHIERASWTLLHRELQELFLEVFDYSYMQDIIGLIHKGLIHKGLTTEDIVNWYNKGKKILALITFDIDYIKSV